MKEQSFEGATEADAKARADEWIKTQPGIWVKNIRRISSGGGSQERGGKVTANDHWTVTVEYERDSN